MSRMFRISSPVNECSGLMRFHIPNLDKNGVPYSRELKNTSAYVSEIGFEDREKQTKDEKEERGKQIIEE